MACSCSGRSVGSGFGCSYGCDSEQQHAAEDQCSSDQRDGERLETGVGQRFCTCYSAACGCYYSSASAPDAGSSRSICHARPLVLGAGTPATGQRQGGSGPQDKGSDTDTDERIDERIRQFDGCLEAWCHACRS
jgi:hypothetical protein